MTDFKKRIDELTSDEIADAHYNALETVAKYVYGLALVNCGDDVNCRDVREHADDFLVNDMVDRMKGYIEDMMEADGIEITDPFEDAFGEE